MPPSSAQTSLLSLCTLLAVLLLGSGTCEREVECFVQGSTNASCKVNRLINKDNCYEELRTGRFTENLSYILKEIGENETSYNITIFTSNPNDSMILLYTTEGTIWYMDVRGGKSAEVEVINLPSEIDGEYGVKRAYHPPRCRSDECGNLTVDVRPLLPTHAIEVTVYGKKSCDYLIDFFSSNKSMDCWNPPLSSLHNTTQGCVNKIVTFVNVYTTYHCFEIWINNIHNVIAKNFTMGVRVPDSPLRQSSPIDLLAIIMVVICLGIIALPVCLLYKHAIRRSLHMALSPSGPQRPLLPQPPVADALLLLYPRNSALLCAAVAALRARLERALSIPVVDPFDAMVVEEVSERPQEWLAQRIFTPTTRLLLLPPPATAAAAAAPTNDFHLYATALRLLQENPVVGRNYTRVFFAGFSGMPFADNQMGLIVPLKRFILPAHLRELVSEIERSAGQPSWRWETEMAALERALEEARSLLHPAATIPTSPPLDSETPLLDGRQSPELRSKEKGSSLLITDLVL